jgi:hypothetical protein
LIARVSPLALLLSLLVAAGCKQILGIPGDPSAADSGPVGTDDDGSDDDDDGEDDGTDPDGSPGGDASPDPDGSPPDAGEFNCDGAAIDFIGFDDPSEIASWVLDDDPGCDISVAQSHLIVSQDNPPATCRAMGELYLDLSQDFGLNVRMFAAGNPQMSMVYSLILNDGTADIRQRRRLRIERNEGELRFGECTGAQCDETQYGAVVFDELEHTWWRFDYEAGDEAIYFEMAASDELFERVPTTESVSNITAEMVRCVGIELGTDEENDTGEASFDDVHAGQ